MPAEEVGFLLSPRTHLCSGLSAGGLLCSRVLCILSSLFPVCSGGLCSSPNCLVSPEQCLFCWPQTSPLRPVPILHAFGTSIPEHHAHWRKQGGGGGDTRGTFLEFCPPPSLCSMHGPSPWYFIHLGKLPASATMQISGTLLTYMRLNFPSPVNIASIWMKGWGELFTPQTELNLGEFSSYEGEMWARRKAVF